VSKSLEPLGDAVQHELGRFGRGGAIAEIVNVWPQAVGESIARNAWPARIARDGTLHVATSSSTWAFELGLLESDIRERLSAALGPDVPASLRFAPGRLPEPPRDPAETRPRAPAEPTPAQQAEGERLTAQIEDQNLRKVVARAAAASLAKAPGPPPDLVD
jgi:predicted nucleic acid-binding Zn ribbon protein